jgi:DNA-binding winged helix-turn-helix (wHTH) protein/TolB-like protein
VNGRREPIGKRALDILSVLAEARGAIVTKDELLDAVWPGVTVEENALQVHVVALRKALGPEADRLKTIRGVGYQLDIDPGPQPVESDVTAPGDGEPAVEARASVPSPKSAAARPGHNPIAQALAWVGAHRWAVAAAGILAVLAGGWALFGNELGLRSADRIPVVVRALAASGPGAQADAALASGITDELILRLRRMPELRVATAAADGTVPSDEFRNAYVVDGSIRSSGNRLRVTVRLAEAGGEILWSQTLDRGLVDLFDMQEEVAAAIAGALGVSLDAGASSADYGGTDDPEAYAAYLQYYANQWNPDQSVAERYLERAVAIDPHFVRGLVGLSQNRASRAGLVASPAEAEAALVKMDDSSARALAADPQLAIGHAIRGWYMLMRRDMVAADRFIERATELDPGNDHELRTNLAIYAFYTGRARKGASIRQSNELIDPIYRNDPWKIFDFMMLGQYREAIDLYAKLRRNENPSLPAFRYHAYMAYLLMGDEAGAADFARHENLVLPPGDDAIRRGGLATMSDAELRRWAEGFGGPTVMVVAAVQAGQAGYHTQATKVLRWASERPGSSQILLMWHPALAQARRSPEFAQLVTDLGLVEAWRASGDWGDYCKPLSASEISCT